MCDQKMFFDAEMYTVRGLYVKKKGISACWVRTYLGYDLKNRSMQESWVFYDCWFAWAQSDDSPVSIVPACNRAGVFPMQWPGSTRYGSNETGQIMSYESRRFSS